ncbi:HMCN1-like protein, partial [Mya arenaria]
MLALTILQRTDCGRTGVLGVNARSLVGEASHCACATVSSRSILPGSVYGTEKLFSNWMSRYLLKQTYNFSLYGMLSQTRPSLHCTFPKGKYTDLHCIVLSGSDEYPIIYFPCLLAEDGIWLLWQAWSACSVSCGNGTMSRTRDCYFDPDSPKGRICPGNDVVIQNCSMEICQ